MSWATRSMIDIEFYDRYRGGCSIESEEGYVPIFDPWRMAVKRGLLIWMRSMIM
ncbi:hypothetical protein PGT21_035963 [Puccinia graminis f. sp. tritici]|uniref:Uncharacterized protein n=1 Tax=Puccinia graminis f. sp. tritici TaxID=56615 RepID=A0A5B0SK05_PUCGR|nr:hypothetical protein PGTUg99_020602 [Puccinia graminis f. sp. tritici]KAA1102099.1 hypothetical protein PGT21_035963 [Puccinia graminis f. sp. tritici]KAA1138212.1 hypothetical protein PGTUg99_019254 [Puccinia graminis f. sp. tritici]